MLETSGFSFTPAQLKELKISQISYEHHDEKEFAEILTSIVEDDSLHVHYNNEYGTAMSIHKKDIIDRLPSKKKELEALAAADDEEKKRLEGEKAKREAKERNRIITLLDQLKGHGLVSALDAHDRVIIRPIITHLANPENLQALVAWLREQVAGATTLAPGGEEDVA